MSSTSTIKGFNTPAVGTTMSGQSLSFTRYFTKVPQEIKFTVRDSVITEPDGKRVFEMRNVEVPSEWTQHA